MSKCSLPTFWSLGAFLLFSISCAGQNPQGRFVLAPAISGGGVSVAVGDLNGDHQNDLISDQGMSVAVALANGDGTYKAPTLYFFLGETAFQPRIRLADVNGDGKLDVILPNGSDFPDPSGVLVFLGNGDGTLQTPQLFSTGPDPVDVVVADFNGDGKLDMASANFNGGGGQGTVTVFLGNGDGTFRKGVDYVLGNGCSSIVAGDFSGDGKLDLAVANFSDSTITILVGKGDGTFTPGTTLTTVAFPIVRAAIDLNGDKNLDLVVGTGSSGGSIGIFLGNGDGTFQTQQTLPIVGSATAIEVGDFNSDGKLDLAVADEASWQVSIFLGNGDGTFHPRVDYATFAPDDIKAGDFNGDGITDLLVVNGNSSPPAGVTQFLFGNGDGTFRGASSFAGGGGSILVNDLNHDGHADIVALTSGSQGGVQVLLGDGAGGFRSGGTYLAPTQGRVAMTGADFNGDGNLDLAVLTNGSPEIGVLLGNGDGSFQAPVIVPTEFAFSIGAADFNGDGKPDLVVPSSNESRLEVSLGKGDGTFAPALSSPTDFNPTNLAIGDFNNDGKPDVAVTIQGDFSHPAGLDVLLGKGDGTFGRPTLLLQGLGLQDVGFGTLATGDLNGDGNLDLIDADGGSDEKILVLLGNGDGTFRPAPSIPVPISSGAQATVADFNGDGLEDILVADGFGNFIYVIYGNGDGTFQPPVPYLLGAPSLVAVGDFNEDGALDIALSRFAPAGIAVALNSGGIRGTLSSSQTPATEGMAFGLRASLSPTVKDTTASPTGTVTFKDGGTVLGTTLVSAGQAAIGVSLSAGNHAISARYNGDQNYVQADLPGFNQKVLGATVVSMTSSINPSIVGQGVMLTAKVSSKTPGTPTGSITFMDGVTTLGTVSLDATASASLTSSALTSGVHFITGVYSGDQSFGAASSSSLIQLVNNPGSTPATNLLSKTETQIGVRHTLLLTATVSAAAGSPTGSVVFIDGSTILVTSPVVAGTATFSSDQLTIGQHSITAFYSGDSSFQTASSSPVIYYRSPRPH